MLRVSSITEIGPDPNGVVILRKVSHAEPGGLQPRLGLIKKVTGDWITQSRRRLLPDETVERIAIIGCGGGGVLERRWRHGGGQHPAIGVYDRINWSFIRYILGYRRSMLPRVHRLIADHAPHAGLAVLRKRLATQGFLAAQPGSGA